MVKSGVVTPRLTVVEWLIVPSLPTMVSVKLPAGVVPAVVVTVKVELPDPLIEEGTNDEDAPAGKPVAESAMVPE